MRLNGRVYEAVVSTLQRRRRFDLYHSALEVATPEGVWVIEMAPELSGPRGERGAVTGGPVGSSLLGRWALFRYEVRRWLGGAIPDLAEAVDSPRRLTDDPERVRRLLERVPEVPAPTWGRDELRAGEMWNSNSVISWLVASVGLDVDAIAPPVGGRAPGWDAGVVVAGRRSTAERDTSTREPAAAQRT